MTTSQITPVLTEKEVETFWSEGYLVVPGVLTREEAGHFAGLTLGLLPRDLSIPAHWQANEGRFKPYYTPGNQTFDGPEFIPLFQNDRLYAIAAQLLQSHRLLVRDGSLAITMRNDTVRESELSQQIHIDPAVPEDVDDFLFTPEEVEIGGCFYFTDVEPQGGAIHLVPGGHRLVEREAGAVRGGRQLYDKWRDIPHLDTVEVTGAAGDFVLMHHLMPHAASHNRRATARVAQFLRYARDDQPFARGERPGDSSADHTYNELQRAAMSPLGRKLFGVDPW
jgi:hypothetical protein